MYKSEGEEKSTQFTKEFANKHTAESENESKCSIKNFLMARKIKLLLNRMLREICYYRLVFSLLFNSDAYFIHDSDDQW